MTVHISGTFKRDNRELNGLEEIQQALTDQPLTRRYAVICLQTVRIVQDMADESTRTPTVRIMQIEPVTGETEETVQKIMFEAYEARTGKPAEGAMEPTLFDRKAGDGGDDGVSLDDVISGEPEPWTPGDRTSQPDEWLDKD